MIKDSDEKGDSASVSAMETKKRTKEEWHTILKDRLKDTIAQMVKSDCDLPDDLELFYCVREYIDRYQYTVSWTPTLTKERAEKMCEELGGVYHSPGKYGYKYVHKTAGPDDKGDDYNAVTHKLEFHLDIW